MNERKELIARLRLDYTASKLALSLMKQAADMLEADSEPKCSDHPDAPHGFSRNVNHTVGRYVCACEWWVPEPAVPQEPVVWGYELATALIDNEYGCWK